MSHTGHPMGWGEASVPSIGQTHMSMYTKDLESLSMLLIPSMHHVTYA